MFLKQQIVTWLSGLCRGGNGIVCWDNLCPMMSKNRFDYRVSVCCIIVIHQVCFFKKMSMGIAA